MKSYAIGVVATLSVALLCGCAEPPSDLSPARPTEVTERKAVEWSTRPAVTRVRLPASYFKPDIARRPLPRAIAEQRIAFRTPRTIISLDELAQQLETLGIAVAYDYDRSTEFRADDFADQPLRNLPIPIRSFDGTLEELLSLLSKTLGIAYWWDDPALFISLHQRYAVAIPQETQVLDELVTELGELGAINVIGSLRAGQVIYYAEPKRQEEAIGPYLRRLGRNFAEITLQVALVDLALTDSDTRGFDWSAFSAALSDRSVREVNAARESALRGTTLFYDSPPVEDSVGEFTQDVSPDDRRTATLTGSAITLGLQSSGVNILGGLALDVASVINFLSSFGRTDVDQNLEVRTLSGSAATIRSTSSFPYVAEASTETNADAGTEEDTVTFEEIEIGLTIEITPRFDADTGIITMVININNDAVLSFDPIPTESGESPSTTTRSLAGQIVRLRAGETAVIGGIGSSTATDTRSSPFGLWEIGSSSKSVDRSQLFFIVRPLITVYELSDNPLKTMAVGSAVDVGAEASLGDLEAVIESERVGDGGATDRAPRGPAAPLPLDRTPAGGPADTRYFNRVLSDILQPSTR